MVKHRRFYSHRSRSYRPSRSHRSRSRKYRGGVGTASPSSYSSASSWMNAINGTEDAQYGRVFNQSSPFPPNGNAIIGAQGQRAGGRKRSHRRRHRSRKHRGGFMGSLTRAITPLALVGLNQLYGSRHSRRHHK